jgi:hypothetical protein
MKKISFNEKNLIDNQSVKCLKSKSASSLMCGDKASTKSELENLVRIVTQQTAKSIENLKGLL